MKKIYSFIFSAFASLMMLNGQNLLIDPAVEGGFELPGGFPGNGWTLVNSTTNTWNISGAAVPFAGLNSAFISSDGGITYGYNNAVIQTSHFYRDVVIPAGNGSINLKFQYKSVGEPFFDRLLVYAAPTSVFPTVNNPQSSNDVIPGATLLYSDPALNSVYQSVNLFIPSSFAGTTTRLIFTWQNDISSASVTAPVSVDNIYLYSQPIAPLNGVYTINNTLPTSPGVPASGSNFTNFTSAINYLNANGISGPVTFNVSAGQTFTEGPQTIFTSGTATNFVKFQKSGSGNNPLFVGTNGSTANDAAFRLNGADYVTFDGIDVATIVGVANYLQQMEYGFYITSESPTNGANNNTIKNSKISLDRTNTSSRGVTQTIFAGTGAPGSAAEANNQNTYSNLVIENVFIGIMFYGANTFRDNSCVVEKCTIGGITPFDIGGGTTATELQGIYASFQENLAIKNNTIQNVAGQVDVMGIYLSDLFGISEVSGNNISGIQNTATSAVSIVSGIRVNLAAGNNTARIFNNFISDIRTNFAGLTSTSLIRGINIQQGGGSSNTSIFEVSHNSVYIDGSGSLGCSNSCLESGGNVTTGPQVRIRSNILANFTGSQAGNAKHYCYRTTNSTLLGTAGSLSNNNDFYVFNTTNGFVGRGATTDRSTLANWQAAYVGQDANSMSVDPIYTSSTDLHAANTALNSAAAAASLLPYITLDIDGQTRSTPNSDIGADEFTPLLFDVKPTALVNPPTNVCYSSAQAVTVKIMNYTSSPLDFSFNPVQVTVVVTGPSTQTITTTINNNSLNANSPLAAFSFLDVPVGNINMSAYGNYNFTCYTSWGSDQNFSNDTIKNIQRINIAPASLPQVVSFSGFNGSNLPALFPGWSEAKGATPSGTISLWTTWQNFGFSGNVNAVVSLNTNTRREWILGPKFTSGLNTVLTFKAAVTAIANTSQPASMGADDRVYVMISTDCGATYQKLDSITSLNNLSNSLAQNQFSVQLGNYAGQQIIVGFYATDGSIADGICDFHLDDINIANITTYDFSVTQLNSPLFQTCYNGNQSIVVKLKNTGSIPIDFSAENCLLHADVSGPIPQSFTLPVTTGTLTPNSTQTFTITSSLDLSTAGNYVLKSYLEVPAGDINHLNDTLTQQLYPQNPSVTFSNSSVSVCLGDSVQLFPNISINGIGPANLPSLSSSHAPLAIPDSSFSGINSSISVSGAGGFASQLVGVKIDSLLHTFTGDLVLTLIAPNGSSVVLSANNGGGGYNYISTLFSPSASNTIVAGSAPFTGAFLPQNSFSQLSGSSNGTWTLNVKDISVGDVGTLNKWSLIFKEQNVLTSFNWSPGASLNPAVINTFAHPNTNTTYTFTAIDMNGCSASGSINVQVNTSPVVSVSGIDSICINANAITLQGIPSGGVFSGTAVDSLGNFNPALAGVGSSTVFYDVTNSSNCSGQFSFNIAVLDTPQISFQSVVTNACFQDAPFQLSGATPTGGIYSGNGVQAGGVFNPNDSSLLGTNLISYSFTDALGCSAQVSDTISVSLCLFDPLAEGSQVKIYPNPASDYVNVSGVQEGDFMEVIDLNGKRIIGKMASSEAEEKIELENLSPGIYFLKISFLNSSARIYQLIKHNN